MNMTKAKMAALEKLFIAEVEDRLPFQSKAKIFEQLETEGMVDNYARTFGSGPLAVVCRGWRLTHRGHLEYCLACAEMDENEI